MDCRTIRGMETLLITDDAGVRTMTLNRPDKYNAITETMTTELQAALKDAAKTRGLRCLVLTGAGKAFCSGQDIGAMKERFEKGESMDFTEALRRRYNPIVLAMRAMEIPIIASVNGVAAGAGWSLAMAADLRICSEKASFVGAFSKIGVIPDSGMTWFLPRLMGFSKSLEVAWLGEPISAGTALAMGMVTQVVAPEALAEATRVFAARLAAMPTRALGLAKRALNAAFSNDFAGQLDFEAQLQGVAGKCKDHTEGVRAFLEKREAQFTGE